MIIRIMGEGQVDVPDAETDRLNALDDALEQAIEQGEDEHFRAALHALLEAVRSAGTPVPDESLVDSHLVLPPSDASLAEVEAIFGDEGLIPG